MFLTFVHYHLHVYAEVRKGKKKKKDGSCLEKDIPLSVYKYVNNVLSQCQQQKKTSETGKK